MLLPCADGKRRRSICSRREGLLPILGYERSELHWPIQTEAGILLALDAVAHRISPFTRRQRKGPSRLRHVPTDESHLFLFCEGGLRSMGTTESGGTRELTGAAAS